MSRLDDQQDVPLLKNFIRYVGTSILNAVNAKAPIFHPVQNFAPQPEDYLRTVPMLHLPSWRSMDEILILSIYIYERLLETAQNLALVPLETVFAHKIHEILYTQ